MEISLVSPVYNEEKMISAFVHQCNTTLTSITNSYEIILVNDCSTDKTKEVLEGLSKDYHNLRVINLPNNRGQHIATSVGLTNKYPTYH